YFDNTLMPQSIDPKHPDLFGVWADRTGLVARSDNWPSELDLNTKARIKNHWDLHWAGIRYRGLRVNQVPVLHREEGKSFQPQTLSIVYLSPEIRLQEQVQEAGVFIAVVSLALLGITVLLAVWGIRRGLRPLQQLADRAERVSSRHWDL